jgi:Flp pilus assembly protein TadB
MANASRARKPAWRQVLAAVLLIAAIGLIGWSFVLPSASSRRAAWSQEQALEYQAASIKLHSLSHEFAHEARKGNEEALRPALDKADAEFEALRAELESAMGRPRRVVWLLRFGGVLLAAGGAAILFLLPPPDHDQES